MVIASNTSRSILLIVCTHTPNNVQEHGSPSLHHSFLSLSGAYYCSDSTISLGSTGLDIAPKMLTHLGAQDAIPLLNKVRGFMTTTAIPHVWKSLRSQVRYLEDVRHCVTQQNEQEAQESPLRF